MLCCQLADSSEEFVSLFSEHKLLSCIYEEMEAIPLSLQPFHRVD